MVSETQVNTETAQQPPISNVPETGIEDMRPVALPQNITQLSASEIVLDDEMQVRRFEPLAKDVEEMAKDIVRQGQLYPILYRIVDDKNILIDGKTRVRAIQHINDNKLTKHRMKVNAMLIDVNDLEAFSAGAAANIKRYPMSPIDHARVVKILMERHNLNKSDAGKILGRSPAWVTDIMHMTEFRPNIQRAIHEGKIGYSTAREMVGMDDKDQDEMVEAFTGGSKAKRGEGRTREKVRAKRRAKAQAKGGGETDEKFPLTMKQARDLFASLGGVGKEAEKAKAKKEEFECPYSEKVQLVAKAVLKALDGKLGERALASRIDDAKGR